MTNCLTYTLPYCCVSYQLALAIVIFKATVMVAAMSQGQLPSEVSTTMFHQCYNQIAQTTILQYAIQYQNELLCCSH